MSVSGESATIYVYDAARLRDYFLRLGADASVRDGAVHVQYAGDGSDDDTISAHLRHWVDGNNAFASILLDPPAPAGQAVARLELAPTPPSALFLERPRLGDLLQFRGLITKEQLDEALVEARANGDLLGRVLIRRRFIFGDELARTLADQLDLPYVNLRVVGYEPSVTGLLPSSVGMQYGVLPVGRMSGRVRVAFADPCDDQAKEIVAAAVGDFSIVVADLLEIELAWRSIDPSSALRIAASA